MSRFKKWSLWGVGLIIILILLAVLGLYISTKQAVDRVFGGQTELVDHVQFQIDEAPIAITNVSVLSPNGTEMLEKRTVLLRDTKIISVTQNTRLPDGIHIIDGGGKFLVPGLVDSHAHLHRSPNDLLLYLANGVTQIRSMGGSIQDFELKRQIENGRIGPHLYVSTPSMNSLDGFKTVKGDLGIPDWLPDPIVIWLLESTPNIHISKNSLDAAKDAKAFIHGGRDGIKLYEFLTMDSFRAILDVADELDVPTAAHLPAAMPLSDLQTTKLREIAHVEEIVKALRREFKGSKHSEAGTFLAFVESRKDEIMKDLVANDIAVQSTLWFSESLYDQIFDLEIMIRRIKLEYANPGIVEGHPNFNSGWLPGSNKFQTYSGETPEEIAEEKEYWSDREKAHHILVEAMVEYGVIVLAGTDANAWMTVPGFSLHDELQSLNKGGMTPAQALYSATAAPSQRIGNNAGIIAEGRRADLLLLNDNPLEDIANTRSIEAVIINGKLLNRESLALMLAEVKEANEVSRRVDIAQYR